MAMNTGTVSLEIQSMLHALEAGQKDDARAQAQSILGRAPGEPNASQVLAMLLLQEGKARDALPHLEAADRAAPHHPPILNMMGSALKRLDRIDDAREQFGRAIAQDAQFIDARLNLAQLDFDEARIEDAKSSYDFVLDLQPNNVTAIVGRGRVALALHETEQVRDLMEQALRLQPGHGLASLTLAAAYLRLEEFESAVELALPLVTEDQLSAINRAYAAGHVADAYDRLGLYDKAFEHYALANDLQADQFENFGSFDASPFSPAVVENLSRHLESATTISVPPCGAGARMPVFLVGFPRSGTTLIEQILMSHPKITSFDEHTALSDTCFDLYVGDDALNKFDELDEHACADRRDRYWQEINKLGELDDDAVFLDKLPLNSVFLPAIAKIFPRAKVLFALRDPRDVVLSCFQQRFGMNVAMYQLLSLETAAQYYDATMKLAMKARSMNEFALQVVRYETVVANTEDEARRAIEFIGLEWDPAVMSYRENARARAISTPSAPQVVEPIYTRSQGKWKNYAVQMAIVDEILEPWVERFGYA